MKFLYPTFPTRTVCILILGIFIINAAEAQFFKRRKKKQNSAVIQNNDLKASEKEGEIRIWKSLKINTGINYVIACRRIDSLLQIRQFKTAGIEVQSLRLQSLKDARTGYWIKSVLYESEIIQNMAEQDEKEALQWTLFLNEYNNSGECARMLLSIEMADFLKVCFTSIRWVERTDNNDSKNPAEWSLEKLNSEINRLINESSDLSALYTLGEYLDPLLENRRDYDWFIDLEDIIALRAIRILSDLELPVGIQYRSPDPELAMSEASEFLKMDYKRAEDPKNEFRILQFYQLILKRYHVYFDLQRMSYLRDHYHRNDLYWSSIHKLYNARMDDPYSNIIAVELANFYSSKEPAKSMEIVSKALQKHPEFIRNDQLIAIRANLLKPELSMLSEAVYPPGKKILAKVDYKNTDSLFIRVYKIGIYQDYLNNLEYNAYYNDEMRLKALNYLKGLQQVLPLNVLALPDFRDLRSHSAEFALNALPEGTYIILSGNRRTFEDSALIFQYKTISVSPHTIVRLDKELILMNAMNGIAVEGKSYKIWHIKNRWNAKEVYQLYKSGKTGKDGKIELPEIHEWGNSYLIEIENASLFFESGNFSYQPSEIKEVMEVKILTDRSIYRPGQTVFFKCIAYLPESAKTLPDKTLTIFLQDGNGEEKGKMVLKTNAFGSCSGTFILPSGGFVAGRFRIYVKDFQLAEFRVEEYKRPKYTATIFTPDSAYRFYDFVEIQGESKALAGYAISNAKVNYTVVRKEKQKYYGGFWRFNFNALSQDQTIITGTTATDGKGKFSIRFQAIPDPNRPESENPYFIFNVSVTVTDLNGEVRTCSYDLNMAYTDRELILQGENSNPINKPFELEFMQKNLQGKNFPFSGIITLKKIVSNSEIKRERYWKKADTSLLTNQEFNLEFDAYKLSENTQEYKIVAKQEFKRDSSWKWIIQASLLNTPGEYLALMQTLDGKGKLLETEFRFQVNDVQAGKFEQAIPLSLYTINGKTFEPGQTARLMIGSGATNATVHLKVASKRGLIFSKIISLNKNSVEVELPVANNDRGNIIVSVWMVNDYRFHSANHTLTIPYSNKNLQVKLSSFRNELEPGSKEKWTISLKGPDSEKTAMELAAVMYDRSLDELYPNNDWQFWIYRDFNVYYDYEHKLKPQDFNTIFSQNEVGYPYREFRYPDMKRYEYNGGYRAWDNNWELGYDDISKNSIIERKTTNKSKESEDQSNVVLEPNKPKDINMPVAKQNISMRKNFNETVFFFPKLYANAQGEIKIEFEMPEALTQWRMQMLAHSKTMQLGYSEQSVTTSKKVMLQPNLPRFLRQGDRIIIASKIINTTNEIINAKTNMTLIDDNTGKILNWVSGAFDKTQLIPAQGTVICNFEIRVPDFSGLVNIRIVTDAGQFTDGEQNTLLVLSNRSLVTKTLPITIRKSGVQEIEFKDLKNNHSTSLHHQQLCVEMCSNPAWYAIQALPYMMEYPNECSEQIFTRLYANSIAMNLANKNPEINKVYLSWQNQSEKGKNLQSKLLMNQDLKYAMIEETPWLNDAKNESERIQKLGILFNSITMNKEINHAYEQLKEIQSDNGSWPWFKGMQPNNYITQTIVIGFGKMKKMGVDIKPYLAMIEKAINFLDNEALNDYERFQKYDSTKFFQGEKLQYLYCKSFFPTMGFSINNEVIRYFIHASEKQWVSNSMLNQAQLAIALHILKPDSKIPPLILKSFNEMSIQSEEQGMYWPSNSGGWYWYQAPLETQCAVIELYQLMGKDEEKVKEQQIWLMRQKQTQNWSTTRSTADACYALLSSNNLLNNKQQITVSVDSKPLVPESIEQGTGYFRQNVQKETISNSSANINIKSAVSGFSYGAVYWQYFEENDKISVSGSGLKIEKKLFKLVDTEIGLEKIEIKEGDTLKIGDKVEVNLIVSSDRNMEYVYIRDQRAAGLEPLDVLSEYHWKNGLGFYQITKDASTGFFADFMPKGMYQFNYVLKIEQSGIFSSGIATAQCMYAPEYAANSVSKVLIVGE